MIETGIRRPSESLSFCHRLHQKDKSIRPCGKYRRLNDKILPDLCGIFKLYDLTTYLYWTTIYSALDVV